MFFDLVKAGLWEREVSFSQNVEIDFGEVYRLAKEQSVVGLVAAGLERGIDIKAPQLISRVLAGDVLQLEYRNRAMNQFIAILVSEMRNAGIYTLLVKGQGVAQGYERPLWRTCGDVDFFLSEENYETAKGFLIPRASSVEQEGMYGKHFGLTIDGWVVELHGRLRCGFSGRVDRTLDKIQNDTLYCGAVSSWNNGGVQVFKLSKENEVFYVFAHFLGHFYKGGVGLRQICDWCRLLWSYRSELDMLKLESLIDRSGLVLEWNSFGVMAIEYLGMPVEAVPLIDANDILNLKKKAERIVVFILNVGNFGHNRDMTFYREGSYLKQKFKSFVRRMGDLWNHARIFPMDTLRFFPRIMINGLRSAANGE